MIVLDVLLRRNSKISSFLEVEDSSLSFLIKESGAIKWNKILKKKKVLSYNNGVIKNQSKTCF